MGLIGASIQGGIQYQQPMEPKAQQRRWRKERIVAAKKEVSDAEFLENLSAKCHAKTKKGESANPHDVVLGRGGMINQHAGNLFFRRLVERNKCEYVSTKHWNEKRKIAEKIVEQIKELDPPGRFVKEDAETGEWIEVDHARAIEKVMTALRDTRDASN